MFEYQYSDNYCYNGIKSRIDGYRQGLYIPLMWGEHCIECSAPECYSTCNRYQHRTDGHCRRFECGIQPYVVTGVLGAKVRFLPWSKLESKVEKCFMSELSYGKIYKQICILGYYQEKVARFMPSFKMKSKTQGLWEVYRQKLIHNTDKVEITNHSVVLHYSIINEQRKAYCLSIYSSTPSH